MPTKCEKLEKEIDKANQEAIRVAFEWGFRCCEKGLNLQAALAKFDETMKKGN